MKNRISPNLLPLTLKRLVANDSLHETNITQLKTKSLPPMGFTCHSFLPFPDVGEGSGMGARN